MSSRLQWRRFKQTDVYLKDLDAVIALHLEQEQALGRKMQLPNLVDRPVLEAWVAERDGQVVGAFYVEATAEICFIGTDPQVSASARRFAPQVFASMKLRGLRMVRLFVPRWIGREAESIGKELLRTGFESADEELLHFRYDLTKTTA